MTHELLDTTGALDESLILAMDMTQIRQWSDADHDDLIDALGSITHCADREAGSVDGPTGYWCCCYTFPHTDPAEGEGAVIYAEDSLGFRYAWLFGSAADALHEMDSVDDADAEANADAEES
jgi:hypothetical protein